MTVMDLLEFRDMNGPAPMPKSGIMTSNRVKMFPIFCKKYFETVVNNHENKQHGLTIQVKAYCYTYPKLVWGLLVLAF